MRALIDFYMENARVIRDGLARAGLTVYGGRNAPYIWVRTPPGCRRGTSSTGCSPRPTWSARRARGFGPSGEGYFRLTAFGSRAQTLEALERVRTKLA